MARGSESADEVLLRYVPVLYGGGALGGFTDAELLDRFVGKRTGQGQGQGPGSEASERAFGALLERHGPMVLRVCRQVLGDSHQVPDAFQATFLVLVRQAHTIRKRDSVASWLHGVTFRVANRARADATRRRLHEERRATRAPVEAASADEGPPADWPALHEEVARLPEKFRQPVVLCYLEGLSTEAAADVLGCPRGTVLSRLSRGRARLRTRLTRRGLAPAVGLLAASSTLEAAPVPRALVESTIKAASRFAGGKASAGTPALAAESLAKGAIWSMSLTRLKTLAAAALALGALVGGTAAAARQAGRADTTHEATSSPSLATPHPEPAAPKDRTVGFAQVPPTASEVPADPTSPPPAAPPAARTVEQLVGDKVQADMMAMDLETKKERLRSLLATLEGWNDPGIPGDSEMERAARQRHEEAMKRLAVRIEAMRRDIHEGTLVLTQKRGELDLVAKPGDFVLVEVLEALPGRPITGSHIVGPTGLIVLGWYGEVQVAGLTNRQIKAKCVEHLRKYISSDALGLEEMRDGKTVRVDPADTDRVYAEIELSRSNTGGEGRVAELEQRVNQLQIELHRLREKR